jgi:hypothetical protein
VGANNCGVVHQHRTAVIVTLHFRGNHTHLDGIVDPTDGHDRECGVLLHH